MGTWSPTEGMNLTRKGESTEPGPERLPNKTLVITSIMVSKPNNIVTVYRQSIPA